MIIGFSVPLYQSFQFGSELEAAVDETTRAIRSAQVFSQEAKNDSEWGIRIQNNTVILFQGASYASRDPIYDQEYTISEEITVTGLNEFYFQKDSGEASTTGTITYTLNSNSRQLSINAKGTITFN